MNHFNLASRNVSQYMTQLRTIIERVGWACQGVMPVGVEDIAFAYTIGLTEVGVAELIISGLPMKHMNSSLNEIAKIHRVTPLEPGQLVDDPCGELRFTVIDAKHAPANFAFLYYQRKLRVLQLLWSDNPTEEEVFGIPARPDDN